eukprot:TRINITY_DN6159_c4_g1_i1.p1 TRINITY_DN6159_c4_g1~~TRINITY_DN6159_c4_g1_i1.p1  ORF type:complete len:704 (-),score=128.41 TRINITY_DN6159_c4_g1_i1:224-2335(-)
MSTPKSATADADPDLPPKQNVVGVGWSNIRSLIDILPPARAWNPAGPYPITPPIAQYIDEAVLGCRHGPGERSGSRRESKKSSASSWDGSGPEGGSGGLPRGESQKASPSSGSDAKPKYDMYRREPRSEIQARRVRGLITLLSNKEDTIALGLPWFWITIAGALGRVPRDGLEPLRDQLAKAWHSMELQAQQLIPDDQSDRDWALASLPILFSQGIYRILYDGFEEDRKNLLANADALIGKLMLVAHYEVAGFQLLPETVQKMRQKLFVGQVLQMPHSNRREFLRGKQRQEMLESRKAVSTDRPLTFGNKNGQGLDDTQLEHVLIGREKMKEHKKEQENLLAVRNAAQNKKQPANKSNIPAEKPSPYDDLPRLPPFRAAKELSVDSYLNLNTVAQLLQDKQLTELAECLAESDDDEISDVLITNSFQVSTGRGPTGAQGGRDEASPCFDNSPSSPGHFTDGPLSDRGTDAGPSPRSPSSNARGMWKKMRSAASFFVDKDEQERKLKLRRQKQDSFHAEVANDPLHPDLCDRELLTTWVSPMTKRLNSSAKDRCILRKTAIDTFHVKMGVKEEEEVVAAAGAVASAGSTSPAVTALPSTANTSGILGRSAKNLPSLTDELITIEPPRNLSAKVIVKRLDDQANAFRRGTFAEWVKEHDVLTGIKKVRIDAPRLQKEERVYLQKMNSLVGRPPCRLLGPRGRESD